MTTGHKQEYKPWSKINICENAIRIYVICLCFSTLIITQNSCCPLTLLYLIPITNKPICYSVQLCLWDCEIFKNQCLFELSYDRILIVSLLLCLDREKYAKNYSEPNGGLRVQEFVWLGYPRLYIKFQYQYYRLKLLYTASAPNKQLET